MDNWQEWSFGMVEGVGEERRGASKLLPHLMKLKLLACPKLGALPEGLRHATNLQKSRINGVCNLKEINNLPSLKSLKIVGCPRLEHVENLDKLQYLRVDLHSHSIETSTTDADGRTERLPQWLLELLQNAPATMQSLKKFRLTCSLSLLRTFLKDRPNWPFDTPKILRPSKPTWWNQKNRWIDKARFHMHPLVIEIPMLVFPFSRTEDR
uniref:Uncharacterized protein LOC105054674 isoform X1 n=1 Tax=Elaeis guineensis var. tenera TaxID=51953 RepID=A0A6J0PPN1_ELAGV|nr:uncharacterized protein LOC105054674 isoform X1 [Elaeis guineensis]